MLVIFISNASAKSLEWWLSICFESCGIKLKHMDCFNFDIKLNIFFEDNLKLFVSNLFSFNFSLNKKN